MHKLPDWSEREDLVGWVRGDEAANPEVTNELARLSSENRDLRATLAARQESFGGLDFDGLVSLLRQDKLDFARMGRVDILLKGVLFSYGGVKVPDNQDNQLAFLTQVFAHTGYIFEIFMNYIVNFEIYACFDGMDPNWNGIGFISQNRYINPIYYLMSRLQAFGLVTKGDVPKVRKFEFDQGIIDKRFSITDLGRMFRNRLLSAGDRDTRERLFWNPQTEEMSAIPPPVKQ